MKKLKILILLIIPFLVFTSYAYDENQMMNYKKELTTELLNEIKLKLPKIVNDNKSKSQEEIINEKIKELETLRKNYKSNDFEYEVITNIIQTLQVEKSQTTDNPNKSSSGSQDKSDSSKSESPSQKENGKSQDSSGKGQNNQDNQNNNPKRGTQVIPKADSMGLGGEEKDAYKPLSDDEKDAIDDYLNTLKQEEKENMRLNKPHKNSGSIFNNLFDFQNDIGGGNYDW